MWCIVRTDIGTVLSVEPTTCRQGCRDHRRHLTAFLARANRADRAEPSNPAHFSHQGREGRIVARIPVRYHRRTCPREIGL